MINKKNIAVLISLAVAAIGAQAAQPAQTDKAESTFTVGAGLAVLPEYAGADKLRAFPVISADYQDASGFFASTSRGIGYATKLDSLTLTGSLGYDAGRSDKKQGLFSGSDALRGMGKIKGAATGNFGIGYDVGPVSLSFGAELALSNRDRGNTYQFGASTPLLTSATDQVTAGITAKYADSKNMQTYYGVTANQSTASGYRVYKPKAGFENVGLGVNWNHVIDKTWSVNTTAGVSRMAGDAANSPLTKRKTAPILMTTVNYKF